MWQGVFPAATTQFASDGAIDFPATLQNLEMLVTAGVHGLVLLGTVGENCSLEYGEKIELLRAVVERLKGRVPLLTGVAECTTSRACRFAADAAEIGLDGLMVLPAMVYKADAREAAAHFRAVARSSRLPIMCYNNPVAYGIDMPPEVFAELADEPTLVAIKESSEDPRRITDLANLCGDRYVLFCGVDDLVMESYALGARGWVSGLVNAFPRENRRLWDLLEAGQWAEARTLYRWYTPLLHLDTHPKLVQYIKMAAAACGYGTETTRPPRLPVDGAEREQVLQIIQRAIATRPK